MQVEEDQPVDTDGDSEGSGGARRWRYSRRCYPAAGGTSPPSAGRCVASRRERDALLVAGHRVCADHGMLGVAAAAAAAAAADSRLASSASVSERVDGVRCREMQVEVSSPAET